MNDTPKKDKSPVDKDPVEMAREVVKKMDRVERDRLIAEQIEKVREQCELDTQVLAAMRESRAKAYRDSYNALRAEGFSRREAKHILMARGAALI